MPLSARLCTASSIVLRGLSYVLLRWITGRFWPAILLSALLYFPLWHYNDAKLRYLEDGPARTLQKHIGAQRSPVTALIEQSSTLRPPALTRSPSRLHRRMGGRTRTRPSQKRSPNARTASRRRTRRPTMR